MTPGRKPTAEYDDLQNIDQHLGELFDAVKVLKSAAEYAAFFDDLCTPAELRSLADRWRVAQLLDKGLPYRSINEISGVSTATITRVARSLVYGPKGYRLVLDRLKKSRKNSSDLEGPMSLDEQLDDLFEAFRQLRAELEYFHFFDDLCTPAELRSLADRWRVAQLLDQGLPYRSINEATGVSTATITRVARSLVYGPKGYRIALDRLKKGRKT